MEIDYRRDLNSNYMILKYQDLLDTDSFQVRMLQANKIPGLLELSIREMDNCSLLYYDITSRQSFRSVLEHHMVSYRMLQDLFRSLFQVLDSLQEYLLPADGLALQTELIYTEGSWEKFSFVFLPGKTAEGISLQRKMTLLMEMLLPKLDHSNQQGVVLGYNLYREVTSEHFSLAALKSMIHGSAEMDAGVFGGNTVEKVQKSVIADAAYRDDTVWEQEEEQRIAGMVKELEEDFEYVPINPILFAAYVPGIVLLGVTSWLWIRYGELRITIAGAAAALLLLVGGYFIIAKFRQRAKSDSLLIKDGKKKADKSMEAWEAENSVFSALEHKMSSGEDIAKKREEPAAETELWAKTPQTITPQTKTPVPARMLYEVTEVLYLSDQEKVHFRLIPESPNLPEICFEEKGLLLAGKLASAVDIVIPVGTVSRMHAKLEQKEDGVAVTDLNSRNGTFVNGEMLQNEQTVLLKEGDEVVFADQKYLVVCDGMT